MREKFHGEAQALEHQAGNMHDLARERDALADKLSEALSRGSSRNRELSALKKELGAARGEVERFQERQAALSAIAREKGEAVNQLEALRKMMKRAKSSLQQAETEKDELEDKLDRALGELQSLRSRTKDDSKDVKRLRRDLRLKDDNLTLLKQRHVGLAQTLSDFQEKMEDALGTDKRFAHIFKDRKFANGKFLTLLNHARKRLQTYEREKKKSKELDELKVHLDASKSMGSGELDDIVT